MSTETKNRYKLGTTVFVASVYFDDGDDFFAVHHRESGIEFDTLAAAKTWASSAVLAARPTRFAAGGWHGEIRRGEYIADNYHDDDFGEILDVELVDDDFRVYVTVEGTDVILEEET